MVAAGDEVAPGLGLGEAAVALQEVVEGLFLTEAAACYQGLVGGFTSRAATGLWVRRKGKGAPAWVRRLLR